RDHLQEPTERRTRIHVMHGVESLRLAPWIAPGCGGLAVAARFLPLVARHRLDSGAMPATSLEQIVSLAKRRGFVFPSSAVYGGLGSTWDYGPLGVELKNNVKRAWWRSVVYDRDDMAGLDGGTLRNGLVWKYSGHEATFSDPMTDCRNCKSRHRADQLYKSATGSEYNNV